MSIFITSDTHFNHKNIIKYTNRKFNSTEEMDSYMINQWNKAVANDDIIIHLGDFAFGNSEQIREYVNKLNGKKILIQGNHDKKGVGFFENCGFTVWKKGSHLPIIKNGIEYNYILSHSPLEDCEIPKGYINLHGHLHGTKLNEILNQDIHKCVSVECLDDYKPSRLS